MTERTELTQEAVLEVVRRTTLEVLPDLAAHQVAMDGTSLADLGANSIDRADIVTMAMEELGITVPVSAFEGVRDIRSLVAVLLEHA